MNFFDLFTRCAQRWGERPALSADGVKRTYREQWEHSAELAKRLPVSRGSLVGISLPDLPSQFSAFFAVQAASGIPLLLHCPLPEHTVSDLCAAGHVNWLLCESGLRKMAEGSHPQDACIGVLTSGSTGTPKVLVRSYESWAAFFPVQNKVFEIDETTSLLLSGTLSFTGNLNTILSVLYAGGTVHATTGLRPRAWQELLERQRISHIYLVPAKLRLLERTQPPNREVKMIFTGSQLLFSGTARNLRESFPLSKLILYYGTSELSYISYIRGESLERKPLSVGRPFPGVEVSIREGMIWASTPSRALLLPSPCPTGDAGSVDEEGELLFEGRRDGMINRGGCKVNPSRVEEALRGIQGVSDAAVIAYQDEKRGEQVAGFVTADCSLDFVKHSLCSRLPRSEQPKKILLVDRIPLNCSGKPDAQALIQILQQK